MIPSIVTILLRILSKLNSCISRDCLLSLANCCVPYSVVGTLFMLWVVTMIIKQPFYINGLEDEEHCKDSAVGALGLFIVSFISSITFIWWDSHNRVRWTEVATHERHDLLPRGMSTYDVRTDSQIELRGLTTTAHDADDDINLPPFS